MNDAVDLRGTVAAGACDWPVTNCYIDAWMQILPAWGMEPLAGLGVTAAQDYEGDQFTFFKFLHEDLERLYGLVIGELSIFRDLEEQVAGQVGLGRLVLVEVDGFYLPDTRATSYRTQHTKTTVAVEAIDLRGGRMTYFHNDGHYEVSGEDYAGIFRRLPGQDSPDVLPPYVEFVRRRSSPLQGAALADAAVALLRRHVSRRPEQNPVAAYRADFPAHMDWLIANPEKFHDYAFVVFRQLGANFQLLGAHLEWLAARGGIEPMAEACAAAATISANAKALQFKAARIANRRRFDRCDNLFDALERGYGTVMDSLVRGLG